MISDCLSNNNYEDNYKNVKHKYQKKPVSMAIFGIYVMFVKNNYITQNSRFRAAGAAVQACLDLNL